MVARRPQSLGEEIANSVSHGIGLVAALVGAPVLLLDAVGHGTTANVVGAGVFVATTILLYTASTLYHAFPHSRAKSVVFHALPLALRSCSLAAS